MFYRDRDAEFLPYFKELDDIVVCSNVKLLLFELGVDLYDANSWRMFLDSSNRSLKCVLLHNTNEYRSVPIGHSITLKETYESIKQVLGCIKYSEHNWKI